MSFLTATCEFTIAALHHYSCFASMTLPYFIDFIKCALEFGKVKIKLLETTFKGKQSIFPHQQNMVKSLMQNMNSDVLQQW